MKIHKIYKLLLFIPLFLFNNYIFAAPIFTPDSQPTGWLARPETTSLDLSNGNEVFYQVDYNPDTWSGDTRAYNIDNQALVQTTGPWDAVDPTLVTAATVLDGLNYDSGRKIVTMNGSTKVAFRWTNLSGTQQSAIGSSAIVDFIRGDRSNEEPNGLSFYAREHVMGDAKHSSPFYIKHIGGEKRIYAGTNDGMLHVFNATNGSEVFAYIPSMLIPNLNRLVNKPFVHTHFVDGPVNIANVDFSGTVKTILVGGLGAGGKGLYALDITNPSPTSEDDAASKIKWEITETTTGFANLGYTYGTPKIARLNNGTAVAIIGNGYVNSGNGHAILYIININTGALINAIDTNSGNAGSPNGLSTPSLVDVNNDGKVDYAYAGDIDGNLWKFDLVNNTSSLVFTTSPAQAITVAPAFFGHPSGGIIVAFATGRILTTGDETDTSVHYAYGIWDGAPGLPVDNSKLLTQTLSAATFSGKAVRTITANVPDWTVGNNEGWKVALPSGERAIGEAPFYNNLRYYFLTTNPTVTNTLPPDGANWLNEFNFFTGGSPSKTIFDLNLDGNFDVNDLAEGCIVDTTNHITCIPVSKFLGSGVFSQPILVKALGFTTTLFAFHPDLPTTPSGNVINPPDPGVSGGHFDFDIYYYGAASAQTISTATADSETKTVCAVTSNVQAEYDQLSNTFCNSGNGFSSGYVYLTEYSTGSSCGGSVPTATRTICEKISKVQEKLNRIYKKCEDISGNFDYLTDFSTGNKCDKDESNPDKQKFDQALTCSSASGQQFNQSITCNTVTTSTVVIGDYGVKNEGQKHVHEYDDKYDVTGVNMLNASEPAFNLPNAITDTTTQFKILVMNQYLNPAAKLSVGGADYENVKTYGNLANETNASTLISSLSTYTRADINTLIYNLPLDAFKSKDWWGDGGIIRAGLIPTKTGCVNKLNTDGSMINDTAGRKGLIGPNGERFNGALAIQIIKSTTPASALELNHNGNDGLAVNERVKYGWRVKQADFTNYVLAEYTSFWHHPNGFCYGEANWIADAPEDFVSNASALTPAAGSADPTDGIFSGGLAIISTVNTSVGSTSTTVVTYSDNSTYTKTEVTNIDGTITVTQIYRNGTSDVTTLNDGSGGSSASYVDPSRGSPQEESVAGQVGRISWHEM
ncbi:MAG: hypothetical protein L3J75_08785 [Methylococcaceae bacterium]|nr:hypothetical protein [Methylococcaceae bacterium]